MKIATNVVFQKEHKNHLSGKFIVIQVKNQQRRRGQDMLSFHINPKQS